MSLSNYGVLKGRPIDRRLGSGSRPHYQVHIVDDDTDYRSGGSLHVDVALNQFLSDTLAVGVQGFYLKQVAGDSGSGALLGDFESEAAGVGPALYWATRFGQQDVSFIAKWLHEFDAENRLEGDHVYVSLAMDW